ncbi:MAG: DNA replication and repair protein RecF [Rikenellaceae bacterium]
MILNRLCAISFKNIEQAELEFGRGINCFVGANGAGKTNVLDALYYLSMCKSFFGLTDGQSIRKGADFFMLDGYYTSSSGLSENVVCSFGRSSSKTLKRNGKEYDKLSEHIGLVPIVMVTPSDISLISESGDERRRYINMLISQIDRDYLNALVRYNRLLAERNKLLKQPVTFSTEELLDVMDMQLVQYASKINSARKDIAAQLAEGTAHYYTILSGGRELVSLTYKSELNDADYAQLLRDARAKDMACGFTTVGVHRDDLKMSLGEFALRKFGSQGQQKSFLTALKLAQYDIIEKALARKPLLLLDDVFDKLDSDRVESLLGIVATDHFGQIFITDCNRERLDNILSKAGKNYTRFVVEDGVISKI